MSTHWRWLALVLAYAVSTLAIQSTSVQADAVAGCRSWYTVRSGDTLALIAASHSTAWPTLASINHLANPNLIYPGQALCLALGGTTSPPTPSSNPPTITGKVSSLEFCKSGTYWDAAVSSWAVPPGCYAGVYTPQAKNYRYEPAFGWCNWWAEEIHPQENIFNAPKHTTPQIGAAVYFPPGDQGASSIGHWAGEILAIRGKWLLISEMNDTWRGAGFGKVNYRYILNDGAIRFIY